MHCIASYVRTLEAEYYCLAEGFEITVHHSSQSAEEFTETTVNTLHVMYLTSDGSLQVFDLFLVISSWTVSDSPLTDKAVVVNPANK